MIIKAEIQKIVQHAMATGDWSKIEGLRGILDASNRYDAVLLTGLEAECDSARIARGAPRIAEMIGPDQDLGGDFLAIMRWVDRGVRAATDAERNALTAKAGIRKRWENATNAVRYADAIRTAKTMMAIPTNTRDDIIEAVSLQNCVKGLGKEKLTRILSDNKALPAARKKAKNG